MEMFLSRMKELKGSMSVSAFARKVEIPQPSMDKYLKGCLPSIKVLRQISYHMRVSTDWLLGLSDDPGVGNPACADAACADLQKKIHDLEVENAALLKALSLVGGRRVLPARTGGSPAIKTA